MSYTFKFNAEFVWFVVVALVTALMQVLIEFDAEAVTDWRVWAIGVGSGLVRAVAAAVIAGMASGSSFGGDSA